MNALNRPLWVAVCSLCVLLMASDARAQRYLNKTIIEAKTLDASMTKAMAELADAAVADLMSAEGKQVSSGRTDLTRALTDQQASPEFKTAFSKMIYAKLDKAKAFSHKKTLVRLNAMIVLSETVDDESLDALSKGLFDESVAVQRWAVSGYRNRVAWWQSQIEAGQEKAPIEQKISSALKTIDTMLDQRPAPHPIVVGPALNLYIDINTAASRAAFVDQLNKRVALHAADPKLSYAAEYAAIERLTRLLAFKITDQKASVGLGRASYRFAKVILDSIAKNKAKKGNFRDAKAMLSQCMQALGTIAARANIDLPNDQSKKVREWVVNNDWDKLQGQLDKFWLPMLTDSKKPFKLKQEDLAT